MKRRYKITLWTLGGVWVIAMLALTPRFISAHRETDKLQHVFDEYSIALVNHNFAEAYQFCGSDFRRSLSYDQFVAMQEALEKQHGKLKSISLATRDVEGRGTPPYWTAVIHADFVYEGKSLRFEYVFHQEDGRWLIYGGEKL
ncbi:MAG: hypothetical protein ACRD33_06645 [Candidatus Acidiferrales bacterium]